ncbi:recombinase family protein (plasmid) [Legionella lytica]|uniref:Recombinase family protein n=1 Tax=Legionella lytica TaxID=96232 RepID=A0ABY4YCX5_9GAMM|nr:helix-turn-helix domain-containing protein [Legionella lytica]USQ15498.1 recombinase family protein [Legionella lytica]USQ15622.1 recombinase family protein [Legionella lytica]
MSVGGQFERKILRERVKSGIAHARQKGKNHGRPATTKKYESEIDTLFKSGFSKSEIAKRLGIGRTSVRRVLSAQLQELEC